MANELREGVCLLACRFGGGPVVAATSRVYRSRGHGEILKRPQTPVEYGGT
jgi:hypothetical protein